MIHNIYDVSVEGSVGNPTLTTYIIDSSESFIINERPMIIVCPGGGYNHVSDREGEMLALQFLSAGFHTAVLKYSVAPATYPAQLLELAKSMELVREHAKEWHITPNRIFIQGSSAGGHLAASYGCFWKRPFITNATLKSDQDIEILRPNGLILSYPVITSGVHAHRGSFLDLLGDKYDELVDDMSLEHQVNQDTPKTFLWHTFEDEAVPVENTLLFIQALKAKSIPFECHIYPRGIHGLSLGNELTLSPNRSELQPDIGTWIELAKTFVRKF